METPPPPLGLYIHFPFCRSLCTYCDFFRQVGGDRAARRTFLAALHREIEGCALQLPVAERRLDTIFLGGGTPSLLTAAELRDLGGRIGDSFRVGTDCEATIEVNPEVPFRRLPGYRRAGWNRLSIGMQAFDDGVLAGVGRRHDGRRPFDCFRAARDAGFENINIDLIGGLPGQLPDRFSAGIARIAALRPDHLSLYLLETDKETPLARDLRRGRLRVPAEEAVVGLYHRARRTLRAAGYEHYEISNFCLPGRRSRHNLKYWTDRPYLGCGPAAHGYLHGVRYARPADLDRWRAQPVPALPTRPDPDPAARRRRAEEAAILGLRLLQGLDLAGVDARYGVTLGADCAAALRRSREAGLLRCAAGRIRLTGRGLLVSNEVFGAFLSDRPPARSA